MLKAIKSIISTISEVLDVEEHHRRFAEDYLAQATSHADLEARQRYLLLKGYHV